MIEHNVLRWCSGNGFVGFLFVYSFGNEIYFSFIPSDFFVIFIFCGWGGIMADSIRGSLSVMLGLNEFYRCSFRRRRNLEE